MKIISFPLLCDDCNNPINQTSEAMVEWLDDGNTSDVRIVHNPAFSPNGNCYKHTNHYHRQDQHLQIVLDSPELKNKLGINL